MDRKEGGQWEGEISMMECHCGHTFPEQRRVTQLATTEKPFRNDLCKHVHIILALFPRLPTVLWTVYFVTHPPYGDCII